MPSPPPPSHSPAVVATTHLSLLALADITTCSGHNLNLLYGEGVAAEKNMIQEELQKHFTEGPLTPEQRKLGLSGKRDKKLSNLKKKLSSCFYRPLRALIT